MYTDLSSLSLPCNLKQSQSYLVVFLNYIICVHLPFFVHAIYLFAKLFHPPSGVPPLFRIHQHYSFVFSSHSSATAFSIYIIWSAYCLWQQETKSHFHDDHKSGRNIFLGYFCCTGSFSVILHHLRFYGACVLILPVFLFSLVLLFEKPLASVVSHNIFRSFLALKITYWI